MDGLIFGRFAENETFKRKLHGVVSIFAIVLVEVYARLLKSVLVQRENID